MSVELSLFLSVVLILVVLSLLKVEKLVRMTFGNYVLLAFSLAFGSALSQRAFHLQLSPEALFLGMQYAKIAEFLLNAQPTLMLVFFWLGLRFFIQNSHLTIRISSELFEKKMQTVLWCVLALGSLLSSLYFALAYFKGAVYEWLFTQEILTPYVIWIPSLWLVVAVVSLIAAAQINIRFSFKKDIWAPGL